MAKSKRFPVMVDESVYNKFKQYSDKSGATLSYLIREALTEWAGTVLAARAESLDEAQAKIVCIDRDGNVHAIETAKTTAAGVN